MTPAVMPTAVAQTASACEPHRAFIEAQLRLRRNAVAIPTQDLVGLHGYPRIGLLPVFDNPGGEPLADQSQESRVAELQDTVCACGCQMKRIGQDVAERLDCWKPLRAA